jgi:hypothetical protein
MMGRAEAQRATAGALRKLAADGITVEPAERYVRRTLNGNWMTRDLVGPAVSCRRPSLISWMIDIDGTDHQAFDPNRDNRHF